MNIRVNRVKFGFAVLVTASVCAGAALAGSTAVVNAATTGGKCSKVGQTQKTKGVIYM